MLASLAAHPVLPAAELAALQGVIAGTVTTPEQAGYDARRAPAIPGLPETRPQAIVACATPSDVAHAVALARRFGVRPAPRSGGHCFAGRSSTDGVVLDVAPMHAVSVDEDGLAVIGAGARLEAVYDALDARGLTLPAGCGATVGIAGLTLGGGLGILGRSHGLTCDSLVGAEVVLADGRILQCDDDHHPDLLWGLRGAGGGQLGVVTALVFRTLRAPATTTFELRWPHGHAAAAIDAWQGWAPDAPDALDATLRVLASGEPDEPPTVRLVGAMAGTEPETIALLEQLVARVGADPEAATHQHAPWRAAKRWLAGRDEEPAHHEPPRAPAGKSGFFRRSLPADAIEACVAHLRAARRREQPRSLSFTPWGGAYNRVAPEATAFPHRRERFLLEHGAEAPPGELDDARRWVRRSWGITRPWGSGGVYPNFPDPELADWRSAYHGDNHARLLAVKARYDPDRTFRFHQSL